MFNLPKFDPAAVKLNLCIFSTYKTHGAVIVEFRQITRLVEPSLMRGASFRLRPNWIFNKGFFRLLGVLVSSCEQRTFNEQLSDTSHWN